MINPDTVIHQSFQKLHKIEYSAQRVIYNNAGGGGLMPGSFILGNMLDILCSRNLHWITDS